MVILPKCRCCQCECPPLFAAEDQPSWWAECRDRTVYATVTIAYVGCPTVTVEMTLTNDIDTESQNWFASSNSTLGSALPAAATNLLELELGCCLQSNYRAPGGGDCSDRKTWFIDLSLTNSAGAYGFVGCDDCAGDNLASQLLGYADIGASHCDCPEFSETAYEFTLVTSDNYCTGNTADKRAATATVVLSYAP